MHRVTLDTDSPNEDPTNGDPRPGVPVQRRGPRRDAAANRARLVRAADEVFARLGPSAQLEDVAAHAGLGVGTAYRHLGSRDAALHAVLATRIDDMVVMADRADAIADPWEALQWTLLEMAGGVARDRGMMALMQGVADDDNAARLSAEINPRIAAVVDRAIAAGELRSDVSVTDLLLILACIDRVAGDRTGAASQGWRRIACLLLDGLRSRRSAPTPMPVPALTEAQTVDVFATPTRRRAR